MLKLRLRSQMTVRLSAVRTDHSRLPTSWLQIQSSGFDSRRYQIFWEVVGLQRGPLSLVSTIEELLGRKSSGSGLESREYGRGDQSRWPRDTLYPLKLALASPDKQRSLDRYSSLSDSALIHCSFLLSLAIIVNWTIFLSLRAVGSCW
jgi:hypothetical protein